MQQKKASFRLITGNLPFDFTSLAGQEASASGKTTWWPPSLNALASTTISAWPAFAISTDR